MGSTKKAQAVKTRDIVVPNDALVKPRVAIRQQTTEEVSPPVALLCLALETKRQLVLHTPFR